MAVVEISVVPIGAPGTSLSSYVAKVVAVAKESGLHYELTAMGTILSGELDEILPVLRRMHESCFESGISRVLTTVRIDDRRDKLGSPDQKIRSVLEKLPWASLLDWTLYCLQSTERSVDVKELVEYLVKSLADHPEEVVLTEQESDDGVVMELKIAQDDLGKIIGKGGNTINAIRTVVQAAASSHKKRARLEIVN